MEIEKHVLELKEEGITTLPGIYTREQCASYSQRCTSLVDNFLSKGKQFHELCQFITNPFRHDPLFFDLLWNEKLDKILSQVLDEDYVLINSNLINRKCRADIKPGQSEDIGGDWHTDSRYLGGQRLDKGFGFIVVTMFSDFGAENAGTQFVPRSHLRRDRPERFAKYDYEQICGEAGTVAIYDSGMWHKAGETSTKDRWGMFSLFGPWFMKPYYRFPEMLGEDCGKKLSKPLRRLLHYTSWPPLHEEERTNTLVRES